MPASSLFPVKMINTPGTKPIPKINSLAQELQNWAASIGVQFTLFYGSTTWVDHNNKRCLDAMTASAVWIATGKRLTAAESMWFGDQLRAYIVKNAVRLGVNGVIWNHGVTGFPHAQNPAYRGPFGERRPYGRSPGQINPHIDHNHIEVDSSRYKKPKGGVVVVDPATYPKPSEHEVYVVKLDPGQQDSDSVYWVQYALNAVLDGDDIKTTGDYDEATVAAVKRFQTLLGDDDIDGDLGKLQTAALFARAKMKMELIA